MAKPKTTKATMQPDAAVLAGQSETISIEAATGDNVPESGPAPAPAQGNEGQAVVAEGGNSSASHDQPDPKPEETVLVVTGPKRGRWRAGRHFTGEPVTLLLADLTDDQVVGICNDPDLTVVHLPAE